MKNEQQFIEDIWNQVSKIEQEVLDKDRTFRVARKQLLRDVWISLAMVIVTVIFVLCLKQYGNGSIYVVAILFMGISFAVESFVSSRA